LGFAAHGHAQGKKSGQKVSTGQNEILSEKDTAAITSGCRCLQIISLPASKMEE
jgi:hypothetical protein